MADIFLSHSSEDNDTADLIKSWLERDRESWSVFLDKHPHDGILAGQGWQDRLQSELQSCRVVLAIITRDWLASRWCFTEAVTATFRGKVFFGVLLDELPARALDVAPPIVHDRQHQPIDLTTGAGWEKLLHALDQTGLDPSHWFQIPNGVGPYPGFVAFEEKDAGVFFGRDAEITEYLDALNLLKAPDRSQALVISGGSGSGKSSLLKAGLIPRLRQQPNWLIVPPFDPSREPIHALFAALRAVAEMSEAHIDLPPTPPTSAEDLTECLQDNLRVIEEKTNSWLLLSLDQAEMLLADSKREGETDASRLLTAVGELLACRTRKLVAVLTIRTEFMPALEHALPCAVRLHDRSLRSITALSEIIEKPAARFGIEIAEGLTGQMVEHTRGADALPLLAYTLRELFETYGDDNLLTVAEYEQLGGVEGAIEKKLHEALSDPKPSADELAAFRRGFVRQLVRVDESAVEGERYLRTAVAREALPDAANRLVDRLQEARLLVGADDGTISIAHERLIRNWKDVPLQTWLAEDSDDRKLIDNLKLLLNAYREGGPLLSEKSLLDAKDFLERERSLEDDERELVQFIQTSLTAEQTRQRRQKWLLGGAGVAALIFLVVAIGAVSFFLKANRANEQASRNAQLVLARQLAAEAQLASRNSFTGITQTALLAAESLRRAETLSGFQASEVATGRLAPNIRLAHDERVVDVEFMTDGMRLVTAGWDNTARLWDAQSGMELHRLMHNGAVYAVSFSADGTLIASASEDKTTRIWDAKSGKELQRFVHDDGVNAVAFTVDGTRVATASSDNAARIWDVRNGEELHRLAHDESVLAIAFTADGTRLVTASWDKTARIWDAQTGEELHRLQHEDPVLDVALTADGSRVATASNDINAHIWDVQTGKEIYRLLHESGAEVIAVTFTADGKHLATATDFYNAHLWDSKTGEELRRFPHDRVVFDVAFTADGTRLATASDDNTARLWDTKSGKELQRVAHDKEVLAIDFTEDETRLASASADETVRLWDIQHGNELQQLPHDGDVNEVAFTTDGTRLATASKDNSARVWDSQSGEEVYRLLHEGEVVTVAFTVDGTRLASGGWDHTARIWDMQTGKELYRLQHDSGVVAVAYSADGKLLATGSRESAASNDNTARIWDTQNGKELYRLPHEGNVVAVAFTADGARLATASDDNTARLWDTQTGKELHRFTHDRGVVAIALSADGTRLASVSEDETARIWDTQSGKELQVLQHDNSIIDVALKDDGTRLATTSSDNSAYLWDTQSGKQLHRLRHDRIVYSVSFSADGTRIASASEDKTTRIWDAKSGKELQRFEHDDGVNAVAFTVDGTRVATASSDNTARIWAVGAAEIIEELCGRLSRNLTCPEWRRYLGEEDYRPTCPDLSAPLCP